MKLKHTIIIILFFTHLQVFSKSILDLKVDSLVTILSSKVDDTTKLKAFVNLDNLLYLTNPFKAIKYNQKYFQFSTRISQSADSIRIKIGLKNMGNSLNNLGIIYDYQGDYVKALDYYFKGLKIRQKLKLKSGIAGSFGNIGIIYEMIGDNNQALQYHQKSLKVYQNIQDTIGIANCYNNMGTVYKSMQEYQKSLNNFFLCLKLMQIIKNERAISVAYSNIGDVYSLLKNYSEAFSFFEKGLTIKKRLKSIHGMAASYSNIGATYGVIGNIKKAIEFQLKSLTLSSKIRSNDLLQSATSALATNYELEHDYKKSLKYFKLFTQYKDSAFSESKSKEIGKLEANYEFEKTQLLKKQRLKKENRKLKEAIERRNNLQYSIILVCILAIFGLVLSLGFISVSQKMAEGLIFFAFLLFFEFLLVLFDPYIENWTGGEPMYKLLVNAILAAAIFPAHAFFERYLKLKLIKNKRK